MKHFFQQSTFAFFTTIIALLLPHSLIAQGFQVDSYLVVDMYSKKILSAKAADEKRSVASLTKIATAMVTLDWAQRTDVDVNIEATVPASAVAIGGPNPLQLEVGDRITLRNALYSALIGSDNLCAETIAHHVGEDLLRRSGKRMTPVDAFVEEMNNLAVAKGCLNTKFTNPHGMDHRKPAPYSTAADMARISIYAMENAGFRFYCSQEKREISYTRGGEKKRFEVKNTNQILGVDKIDGVKTGMTTLAGQCLIVSAERPSTIRNDETEKKTLITPHRLIVVVLGSDNRFDAARSLLKRGWEKYDEWNASGRRISSYGELLDPPKGSSAEPTPNQETERGGLFRRRRL